MEFTGQFVYLNPLLLAVLIASSVGSALSVSIYDSMIVSKGLTYLPILRVNLHDDVTARDVMETDFPLLTLTTSARKLHEALLLEPIHSIPVVSDADAMVFYGCLSRRTVECFYADYLQQVASRESSSSIPSKQSEARRGSSPAFLPTHHALDVTSRERVLRSKRSSLPPAETVVTNAKNVVTTTTDEEDDAPVHLRSEDESFRIDSSVLQVDADTALTKVHLLFEMIKCSRIWVTRRGKLVGRIDRACLHAKATELMRERDAVVV